MATLPVFTAALAARFPTLRVDVEGDEVYVRGTLQVRDEKSGLVAGEFVIEALVPEQFPAVLPKVWEVGGRIPRTMDRHVVPGNGSACLFAPEDQERQFPRGSPLIDFFTGPVYSYFYSQLHFDLTGEWPFGARRHGFEGRLDFYFEMLNASDLRVILGAIKCLVSPTMKGHHSCFCGSGLILRNCHGAQLRQIRECVSPALIVDFGEKLIDYMQSRGRNGERSHADAPLIETKRDSNAL